MQCTTCSVHLLGWQHSTTSDRPHFRGLPSSPGADLGSPASCSLHRAGPEAYGCCVLLPWPSCSVLKYPDWVYSVAARGGLLLVASGPEVHVHDLPTGKLVRKVSQGCRAQAGFRRMDVSGQEGCTRIYWEWWGLTASVC